MSQASSLAGSAPSSLLNREAVSVHDYRTFAGAAANLDHVLNAADNHKRLHSSQGYRPPSVLEARWADERENARFLEGSADLPLALVR